MDDAEKAVLQDAGDALQVARDRIVALEREVAKLRDKIARLSRS